MSRSKAHALSSKDMPISARVTWGGVEVVTGFGGLDALSHHGMGGVLPRVGGAAAVWSVAMVFFQAALLLGYAYAHLLSRTLSPASSALVHLGLLAVAATTLPIGIAQGFEAAPQGARALAAGVVCRIDRSAVRRARRERTPAAKLVRSERSSARGKPLPSLCGVQSRVVRSPDGLPVRCRAAVYAAHTNSNVVGRLYGDSGPVVQSLVYTTAVASP